MWTFNCIQIILLLNTIQFKYSTQKDKQILSEKLLCYKQVAYNDI